jgi:hypothetical protein
MSLLATSGPKWGKALKRRECATPPWGRARLSRSCGQRSAGGLEARKDVSSSPGNGLPTARRSEGRVGIAGQRAAHCEALRRTCRHRRATGCPWRGALQGRPCHRWTRGGRRHNRHASAPTLWISPRRSTRGSASRGLRAQGRRQDRDEVLGAKWHHGVLGRPGARSEGPSMVMVRQRWRRRSRRASTIFLLPSSSYQPS